ncbi:MAG: hypothetical protein RB191_15945 [Terriglobia bacterium]|nr:hypothetical protein [Terriglobia bacterium]
MQTSYRAALFEAVPESERERVTFLTPEELPDFILSLAPPPETSERVVKGYRVKGSFRKTSAEDAKVRQEAIAKLVAKSISSQK